MYINETVQNTVKCAQVATEMCGGESRTGWEVEN